LADELNKQEQIHNKGFNIFRGGAQGSRDLEYGRIKVGPKEVEDAILSFGFLEKILGHGISKQEVL